MIYRVEYTKTAVNQLKKMDERLVNCENPRWYGKALKGGVNEIWRYRVGDYRILAKIEDDRVVVTIVEIGHRKNIYKQK